MSTINNVTAAYAASTSYTSKTTVKKDKTEVSTETAYKEDVAAVKESFSEMLKDGLYREDLYSDL